MRQKSANGLHQRQSDEALGLNLIQAAEDAGASHAGIDQDDDGPDLEQARRS